MEKYAHTFCQMEISMMVLQQSLNEPIANLIPAMV